MASPVPHEARLLAAARAELDASATAETRHELLMAVADHLAGRPTSISAASRVADHIQTSGVPGPLAVASLATPRVDRHEQKTTGAYYTDFRLATYLAAAASKVWQPGTPAVDPASGTGMLLAALALTFPIGEARDQVVAELLCAADLDPRALRGAECALRAAVTDPAAVDAFASRSRLQDSLMRGGNGWAHLDRPIGLILANPPWEKLKVTRHEHSRALGVRRHYGHDLAEDPEGLTAARERIDRYATAAGERLTLHGGGEVDLYKLFLALALELAPTGALAMWLPAGLIRSSGTRALREHLVEHASQLTVEISDNKARYFSIDTRFKFLALTADLGGRRTDQIGVRHLVGSDDATSVSGSATLPIEDLRAIRPDLTVPEVRSPQEWDLFLNMCCRGARPDNAGSPWTASIVREVDMSRDRALFERDPQKSDDLVGIIEGRMVHQFNHGFKRHESGTGRSARWSICEPGDELRPQFWMQRADLPAAARARVDVERVGFCDITGQTNERALLASRIPAGMVCGNKVPTVRFDGDTDEAIGARSWLWLSVVNSLAFDWLLRRVLTTTVNYFLLRSVPMPAIDVDSAAASRLIELAGLVDLAAHNPLGDAQNVSFMRAEIDARVAMAYQLDDNDLQLLLVDFPLLDRGQPVIRGETRSTITVDLVRLTRARLAGEAVAEGLAARVAEAEAVGARAYTPAEAARALRNATV